ncbi:hypothetical protein QQP08_005779 [Theobroma cacao]|nr:hypothetical protein QQP08_005779 [Theobroma cacao]
MKQNPVISTQLCLVMCECTHPFSAHCPHGAALEAGHHTPKVPTPVVLWKKTSTFSNCSELDKTIKMVINK